MNLLSISGIMLIMIPVCEAFVRWLIYAHPILITLNADRGYHAFNRWQKTQLAIHRRKVILMFFGISMLIMALISNIINSPFELVKENLTTILVIILFLILAPVLDIFIYKYRVSHVYGVDMTAAERNVYDDLRMKLESTPFAHNGELRQRVRFLTFATGVVSLLITTAPL